MLEQGLDIKVKFDKVIYNDGGGKGWEALDIIMRDSYTDTPFSTRYFAPRNYKDRISVARQLKHLLEVMGGDWESIPFCETWVDFVVKYKSMIMRARGAEFYAKVINKGVEFKSNYVLGWEVPFICSQECELKWGDREELYVSNDSGYDSSKPSKSSNKDTSIPIIQHKTDPMRREKITKDYDFGF